MNIAIIKTLLMRFARAVFVRPVLYLAARLYYKMTETKYDDHGIELIISVLEDDHNGIEINFKNLMTLFAEDKKGA